MSARACLLCGKSLSRWSGSGDDFCCREHRNQYRLRRGMDRVHEANKVASVMRRRENPRPIEASRLIRTGPQNPRDFPESQPFQMSTVGAPVPPMSLASRISVPGSDPLAPHPAETSPRQQNYEAYPFPIRPRGDAFAVVFRAVSLTSMLDAAPPLPTDLASGGAAAPSASGFEIGGPSVHAVVQQIHRTSRPASRVVVLDQSRPARPLTLAHEGRELRVSMAAGFRVPGPSTPSIRSGGPDSAGATWLPLTASRFSASRYVRPRLELADTRPQSVDLNEPALRVPPVRSPENLGRFRWPGVRGLPTAMANPTFVHRAAVVRFGDENSTQERFDEYRN